LKVRERSLGERHEHTRNSLNNLGLVLSLEGKLEEADGYFRRVLTIERDLLGPDDLQVLILMHNLAGLERDRAHYDEAEALSREVITRTARILPAERPENGLFLAGLAQTLQKQKRYAEAADAFAAARKNLLAAFGPAHARVVKLEQMQTDLYQEWGRPQPAAPQ
jgi:tetratricopeptide (TPR) repeat protein